MSDLETQLSIQIKGMKLPKPEREFKFLHDRRFRFDFCWTDQRIAAEVNGSTWTSGRHSRGSGIENDYEKLNLATINGWKVFQFTGNMIKNGTAIELLTRALTSD